MALRNRDLTFIVKVQNQARAALRDLRRDLTETGRTGNAAARGTDNAAAAQRRAALEAARAAAAARRAAAENNGLGRSGNLLTRMWDASRDALAHWRNVGVNAFDAVRDAMNHMSSSGTFLRAGLAATLLATSALVLSLGVIVRGVTTDYAQFDKQMASVNAALREGDEPITKMSGKFGMLREQAKQLSAATEYSATEVASGMDNLVRAGFNAAQTAAAIKPSLDLATTGNMNLADTTERLGAIMSQYQLDATKAGAVTDVLAYVNAKTAAGIPDLAQAFKYAGSTSHALGISVNETAAALGVLADNGIKGFAAGTAVRELELDLLRLASGTATKKAQAALSSLKIDKDKIDPRKVGLLEAIRVLEEAKIDKAQMDAIFGTRGVTPFTALSSDLKKANEMLKESGNQMGYNARQADDMRNNLATSIDRMKKSWSNLMIAIGDAGVGAAFQNLFNNIAGVVTKVKEFIEWMNSGTPGAEAFGAAMTVIATGMVAYGVSVVTAAIGTGTLASMFGVVAIATAAWNAVLAVNPLVWLIALIAAAVAAIVYFGNSTYEANGKAVSGWSYMKAVVAGVIAWIKTALSVFVDNVATSFNAVYQAAVSVGSAIKSALSGDFAGASEAWANAKKAYSVKTREVGAEASAAYNKAFADGIAKAPRAVQPKPKVKAGPAGVVRGGENDTMLESEQDTRDNGNFLPGKKDRSAESEANKFKNALKSLMQTLVPVIERGRQYQTNVEMLKRGLREGAISQEAYNAAMGNLEESAGQSSDAIGKVMLSLKNEAQALGVSEGSREAATRVFALENDMRKDGIAYLRDGVLIMSAETRARYDNAKATIAQSIAAKALQDAKDAVARADDENRIAREAMALPEAERAAFETAERAKAELRRKGVKDSTDLAKQGADAVRVANETAMLAGRKSLGEAQQDAAIEANAAAMVGRAKERYLTVEQRKLELARSGITDQQEINRLAEEYGKIMDRQNALTDAAKNNMMGGLRDGLREWIDNAKQVGETAKGLISNTLGDFMGAFTDFLTTGKASFGDFLRNTLQGITQLVTQLLMLKALKAVSGPLGFAGMFHTGGMVSDGAKTAKAVDPAVFKGAKRLHSGGMAGGQKLPGLKKGEVPTILLENERVLNPEETQAYNAGQAAAGIMSASRAATPISDSAGGSFVFAPQINNDFSALAGKGGSGPGGMSEKELAELSKAFENDQANFMEKWIQNEMRPGGRLARR